MALLELKSFDLDEGDSIIKFSDFFEPRSILGQGSFGLVVGVVMKSNHREYAVKIIKKTTLFGVLLNDFIQEAEILAQLNHPNIVKFIKVLESDTKIFLVMEWVKGGRLVDFINERHKLHNPLSDEESATLVKNILSAVEYIHSKDILHRDLKPENILIEDKKDMKTIKICDFGLSAQYDIASQVRSFDDFCGTKIFMAPELWTSKKYSKPVDMWSCGIILYMVISGGKHPIWRDTDNTETYRKKLSEPHFKFSERFNKYSKHLFLKLIDPDPRTRYTAEVAKTHPWITRKFEEEAPLMGSEKLKAYSKSLMMLRIIKILYIFQRHEEIKAIEESYKELVKNVDEDLNKTGKTRHSVNVKDAIRDVIATLSLDPEKRVFLENDMFTTPPPKDFFIRSGATRDRSNTETINKKSYFKGTIDKELFEKTPPKSRYTLFKNLFLSPLSNSMDGTPIVFNKQPQNKPGETYTTAFGYKKAEDLPKLISATDSNDSKSQDENNEKMKDQINTELTSSPEFQNLSTISHEELNDKKFKLPESASLNIELLNNPNTRSEKISRINQISFNTPSNNNESESPVSSKGKNFLLGSLMRISAPKTNKPDLGYYVRTGNFKTIEDKGTSYSKANSVEKEKSISVENRSSTRIKTESNYHHSNLDAVNISLDLNKKKLKKPISLEKKKRNVDVKKLPQIFDRLFAEGTERSKLNSSLAQDPIVGVKSAQNKNNNFRRLAERSSINFAEKKSVLFASDFYGLPKIKLMSNQEKM